MFSFCVVVYEELYDKWFFWIIFISLWYGKKLKEEKYLILML